MEHLESRQMLAADGQVIGVYLEATDLAGTPITQVVTGEQFLIKVYVEDRRGEPDVDVTPVIGPDGKVKVSALPQGIFEAFMNITYDSEGFEFDPTYSFQAGPETSPWANTAWGEDRVDGLIYQAGLVDLTVSNQLRGDRIEFFSFRMTAEAPGLYTTNESFVPYFSYYDVKGGTAAPEYIDGVPVMERLTGADYENSLIDGSFLLNNYEIVNPRLTLDSQVYFEGVDLAVLPASAPQMTAEFDIRVVTNQTTPNSQAEVTGLPSNVELIDEWQIVYVEVYGQAPTGHAIQNAIVEIQFDPSEYQFAGTDQSQLKHTVGFTDTSTSGRVQVGFESAFENVGDNNYGLIGRIRLQSLLEAPSPVNGGGIETIAASPITLSHVIPTVTSTTDSEKSIVGANENGAVSLVAVPVIFDADDNGSVGLGDFSAFVSAFGQETTDPAAIPFDYDGNGKVGLSDFSHFVSNFGQSRFSGSTRIYSGTIMEAYFSSMMLRTTMLLEGEPTSLPTTQGAAIASGPPQLGDSERTNNGVTINPIVESLASYVFPIEPNLTPTSADSFGETVALAESQSSSHSSNSPDLGTEETALLIAAALDESEELNWTSEESDDFLQVADQVLAQWDQEEGLLSVGS